MDMMCIPSWSTAVQASRSKVRLTLMIWMRRRIIISFIPRPIPMKSESLCVHPRKTRMPRVFISFLLVMVVRRQYWRVVRDIPSIMVCSMKPRMLLGMFHVATRSISSISISRWTIAALLLPPKRCITVTKTRLWQWTTKNSLVRNLPLPVLRMLLSMATSRTIVLFFLHWLVKNWILGGQSSSKICMFVMAVLLLRWHRFASRFLSIRWFPSIPSLVWLLGSIALITPKLWLGFFLPRMLSPSTLDL